MPTIPSELSLALSSAVTSIASIILSMLIELFPPFATWWDGVEDRWKKSYRGLACLLLTLLTIAFLHFADYVPIVIATLADALRFVLTVLVAWVISVLGTEVLYQTSAPALPRKKG